MFRRLLCPLFIVACTCACAHAQDDLKTTLLAKSDAAYAAVQKGDVKSLKAMLTDDFLDVEDMGVENAAALDDELAACKTKTYKLLSPQLRSLSKDSAFLVYQVHQSATCDGKPLPENMLGTDTFVRRNGQWLIAVHTEIPLAQRPAAK